MPNVKSWSWSSRESIDLKEWFLNLWTLCASQLAFLKPFLKVSDWSILACIIDQTLWKLGAWGAPLHDKVWPSMNFSTMLLVRNMTKNQPIQPTSEMFVTCFKSMAVVLFLMDKDRLKAEKMEEHTHRELKCAIVNDLF